MRYEVLIELRAYDIKQIQVYTSKLIIGRLKSLITFECTTTTIRLNSFIIHLFFSL